MTFEWNASKAVLNRIKHGIRFEEAQTAFDDPFGLRAEDEKHSQVEPRQWLIGIADSDRILVVIFVVRRQGEVIRLISARPANRREPRLYEAHKGIPV